MMRRVDCVVRASGLACTAAGAGHRWLPGVSAFTPATHSQTILRRQSLISSSPYGELCGKAREDEKKQEALLPPRLQRWHICASGACLNTFRSARDYRGHINVLYNLELNNSNKQATCGNVWKTSFASDGSACERSEKTRMSMQRRYGSLCTAAEARFAATVETSVSRRTLASVARRSDIRDIDGVRLSANARADYSRVYSVSDEMYAQHTDTTASAVVSQSSSTIPVAACSFFRARNALSCTLPSLKFVAFSPYIAGATGTGESALWGVCAAFSHIAKRCSVCGMATEKATRAAAVVSPRASNTMPPLMIEQKHHVEAPPTSGGLLVSTALPVGSKIGLLGRPRATTAVVAVAGTSDVRGAATAAGIGSRTVHQKNACEESVDSGDTVNVAQAAKSALPTAGESGSSFIPEMASPAMGESSSSYDNAGVLATGKNFRNVRALQLLPYVARDISECSQRRIHFSALLKTALSTPAQQQRVAAFIFEELRCRCALQLGCISILADLLQQAHADAASVSKSTTISRSSSSSNTGSNCSLNNTTRSMDQRGSPRLRPVDGGWLGEAQEALLQQFGLLLMASNALKAAKHHMRGGRAQSVPTDSPRATSCSNNMSGSKSHMGGEETWNTDRVLSSARDTHVSTYDGIPQGYGSDTSRTTNDSSSHSDVDTTNSNNPGVWVSQRDFLPVVHALRLMHARVVPRVLVGSRTSFSEALKKQQQQQQQGQRQQHRVQQLMNVQQAGGLLEKQQLRQRERDGEKQLSSSQQSRGSETSFKGKRCTSWEAEASRAVDDCNTQLEHTEQRIERVLEDFVLRGVSIGLLLSHFEALYHQTLRRARAIEVPTRQATMEAAAAQQLQKGTSSFFRSFEQLSSTASPKSHLRQQQQQQRSLCTRSSDTRERRRSSRSDRHTEVINGCRLSPSSCMQSSSFFRDGAVTTDRDIVERCRGKDNSSSHRGNTHSDKANNNILRIGVENNCTRCYMQTGHGERGEKMVGGDRSVGERMTGDRVTGDRMRGDRMRRNRMTGDVGGNVRYNGSVRFLDGRAIAGTSSFSAGSWTHTGGGRTRSQYSRAWRYGYSARSICSRSNNKRNCVVGHKTTFGGSSCTGFHCERRVDAGRRAHAMGSMAFLKKCRQQRRCLLSHVLLQRELQQQQWPNKSCGDSLLVQEQQQHQLKATEVCRAMGSHQRSPAGHRHHRGQQQEQQQQSVVKNHPLHVLPKPQVCLRPQSQRVLLSSVSALWVHSKRRDPYEPQLQVLRESLQQHEQKRTHSDMMMPVQQKQQEEAPPPLSVEGDMAAYPAVGMIQRECSPSVELCAAAEKAYAICRRDYGAAPTLRLFFMSCTNGDDPRSAATAAGDSSNTTDSSNTPESSSNSRSNSSRPTVSSGSGEESSSKKESNISSSDGGSSPNDGSSSRKTSASTRYRNGSSSIKRGVSFNSNAKSSHKNKTEKGRTVTQLQSNVREIFPRHATATDAPFSSPSDHVSSPAHVSSPRDALIFPPAVLQYVFVELLKNAMGATMRRQQQQEQELLSCKGRERKRGGAAASSYSEAVQQGEGLHAEAVLSPQQESFQKHSASLNQPFPVHEKLEAPVPQYVKKKEVAGEDSSEDKVTPITRSNSSSSSSRHSENKGGPGSTDISSGRQVLCRDNSSSSTSGSTRGSDVSSNTKSVDDNIESSSRIGSEEDNEDSKSNSSYERASVDCTVYRVPGGAWVLVSDRGVGMDAETKSTLFKCLRKRGDLLADVAQRYFGSSGGSTSSNNKSSSVSSCSSSAHQEASSRSPESSNSSSSSRSSSSRSNTETPRMRDIFATRGISYGHSCSDVHRRIFLQDDVSATASSSEGPPKECGSTNRPIDRIESCSIDGSLKRKSNSTSEEPRLSGYAVGLILSRAYLRYFGGDLVIRSALGKGTDVVLFLPSIETKTEVLPEHPALLQHLYEASSSSSAVAPDSFTERKGGSSSSLSDDYRSVCHGRESPDEETTRATETAGQMIVDRVPAQAAATSATAPTVKAWETHIIDTDKEKKKGKRKEEEVEEINFSVKTSRAPIARSEDSNAATDARDKAEAWVKKAALKQVDAEDVDADELPKEFVMSAKKCFASRTATWELIWRKSSSGAVTTNAQ